MDYVIDDVRFKNEKKMIEELGGKCWFVLRPTLHNISDHASENSIRWQDCWNNVIVNDIPLIEIKSKWEGLLKDYDASVEVRNEIVKSLMNADRDLDADTIDVANTMLISPFYLTYRTPELKSPIFAAEMTSNSGKDHTLKLELEDGTEFITSNPLEIEDLKFDIAKSGIKLNNDIAVGTTAN